VTGQTVVDETVSRTMNSLQSIPLSLQSIFPLIGSHVFMMLAWCGHLNNRATALGTSPPW